MNKIRVDDEVILIAGKDKGRRGIVLQVDKGNKIVVKGLNLVKKHKKANQNSGDAGGIIEQEAAIQISNAAIWNAARNAGDRVGFTVSGDGVKQRTFKSSGEPIDV